MTTPAQAPHRPAGGMAGDTGVPRRLARVGRQLVVGAAAAAAYFVVTRWLLDRFGSRGFLYALLALAAVVAILREFSPDLKALPGRIRELAPRRRAAPDDAKVSEAAGPAAEPATVSPERPEPTTRAEAEAIFAEQRERLEQGAISAETFAAFAKGFQLIDQQGKFWTIQPENGTWAYFKGGQWHAGLPLGVLTRRTG